MGWLIVMAAMLLGVVFPEVLALFARRSVPMGWNVIFALSFAMIAAYCVL